MRRCNNFITSYLKYTEALESPRIYNLFMGLSVVASCLQRKCWTPFVEREGKLYPNLYVILVGASGVTRKGTAMRAAKHLMSKAGIVTASNAMTRQALIQEMIAATETTTAGDNSIVAIHSSLTVFSEELVVLLGYKDMEFLGDLCEFYDCTNDFKKRTVGRGVETIEGVWLNLVGATTPLLLQSQLPEDAIGGGFTSRTIFVYGKQPSKKRSPIPCSVEDYDIDSRRTDPLIEDLVHDMACMLRLNGPYYFSRSGKEEYEKWYTEGEEESTRVRSRWFQNYNTRRPSILTKLSLICCAARGDIPIIESGDIRVAKSYLYEVEKDMPLVFQGYGHHQYASPEVLVLEFLKFAKEQQMEIRTGDLLEHFEGSIMFDDLITITENLMSRGRISVRRVKGVSDKDPNAFVFTYIK